MREIATRPIDATMNDHFDLHYHDCALQGIRYATAMLRNASDAEEAVQESFYRIHKSDPTLNASDYRSRFFTILRNHCIDKIRRRKVSKEMTIGAEIDTINGRENDKPESTETVNAIEAELNALPENYRQALLLKIQGQLSYEEIAAVTESTHGQVRTWIYRARRQLESSLQLRGLLEQNNLTNQK